MKRVCCALLCMSTIDPTHPVREISTHPQRVCYGARSRYLSRMGVRSRRLLYRPYYFLSIYSHEKYTDIILVSHSTHCTSQVSIGCFVVSEKLRAEKNSLISTSPTPHAVSNPVSSGIACGTPEASENLWILLDHFLYLI